MEKSTPKTAMLRGRRYRLVWKAFKDKWASCDNWRQIITFEPGSRGFDLLEFAIHEALHACFPDMSEDCVDGSASDIAHLIWNHRSQIFDEVEEAEMVEAGGKSSG